VTKDDLIPYLLGRGREIILEDFERTSCIISTRVAVEVLKAHGIEARAQAVKVEALNATAVWDVKTRAPEPRLGSYIAAVEGTGVLDQADNSWDGHLVAIFTDAKGEVLLDLSADQFARPQHGIHAEPLAMRFAKIGGWPIGRVWPNGSAIAYAPVPSRSYRSSSNWDRGRWGPVFERIMGEIR
jgi:hypothetical protein